MTDIIQEYWDIETLRQRVKDLEASTGSKRVIELQERVYLLEDKLAALKQQGEPVVWRVFNTAQSCWEYGDEDELAQMPYTLQPPEKLYTSAPTIPAGQKVTVDTEGVRFGKGCWMSHEAITGCSAEQLNAGICGVIGKQYMEWVQTMLAAAPKHTKETQTCFSAGDMADAAAKAAQVEREECAKVCDDKADEWADSAHPSALEQRNCALAIRMRGKVTK